MGYEDKLYFAQDDPRKIAIYSRKSKFTGKGDSIENQIDLSREEGLHAARVEGVALGDDDFLIFEDEGYSGKNLDRPGFQEMMRAVDANQIKVIICYRLDRISRNTGDFCALIDKLKEMNVAFISVKDRFDTTTPTGRAMMKMVSVFAELERDTIAERIQDNMIGLAKTGRWLGGIRPTGYDSAKVEKIDQKGEKRQLWQLTQIPEEIAVVQQIYQIFLKRNSIYQVVSYLEQNRILTKNGKTYAPFTIRNILTNPVYMVADQQAYEYFESIGAPIYSEQSEFDGEHGVMVYNKTNQTGKGTTKTRPIKEWVVAVGKHQGAVSGKDWTEVQHLIQSNSHKATEGKKKKARSNVALLSGLLYCGECGDFMRPKLSQRISKEYDEYIYDYVCETKERSKKQNCDNRRATGNTLDRLVCAEVCRMSPDGSSLMRQMEQGKKQIRGKSNEQERQLENLHKQVASHEKQITSLISSLAETDDAQVRSAILREIASLQQQAESKNNQIAEIESIANSYRLSDETFNLLRDQLKSFARAYDTLTVEQKRDALRGFIRKIIWDGEMAHILFFGAEGPIESNSGCDEENKAVTQESQMKSSCTSATKKRPPRMSP